jgi:hypothetical protein
MAEGRATQEQLPNGVEAEKQPSDPERIRNAHTPRRPLWMAVVRHAGGRATQEAKAEEQLPNGVEAEKQPSGPERILSALLPCWDKSAVFSSTGHYNGRVLVSGLLSGSVPGLPDCTKRTG